jgi:hypothetical protein
MHAGDGLYSAWQLCCDGLGLLQHVACSVLKLLWGALMVQRCNVAHRLAVYHTCVGLYTC